MCNRYGYQHPYARLVAEFTEVQPVRWWIGEPNAPRDQIRPTNRAQIIRPTEDGELELVEARWGLIPWFHTKAAKEWKMLGANARAETVHTTAMYRDAYKRRRCLVPATHYFEWTGEKGAKTMWRFHVPDQEVFAFPGLWDRATCEGEEVESFTLLTSAPGPDQAPYHNRQPVILRREEWADWLGHENHMAPSFLGSPAGSIRVQRFAPEAA